MSKVLISNLIDEINTLLSRPVGSVSRKATSDTIHLRDQLKQLRSHLEGLNDDSQLENLDKQCQALFTRLQNSHIDIDSPTSNPQSTRTDKLEISPALLVSPVVSNSFGAESDLIQETSTMTDGTPESNSFVSDRMIAALQQAIQQTLQQVVKESVQMSVQQVVSQTFAVERALMVGEISASINKLVESHQQSQISQELITLNQQKQKLSAEILQLESDRAAWMQKFQEFQASQQESLDHSLRSVKTYLQDQIRDQITDTVQQTVTGTVNQTVAQTIQETLQDNLGSLPSAAKPDLDSQREQEFANKVQEQTDRFLLHLDQMFSSTFRSLEQDIQEYQNSIESKLGHIETLEQKGEALINALVDRINQQRENPVEQTITKTVLPELPDDIPSQYLETAVEDVDENLINALLAGNEFGEPIVEPVEAQIVEVSPLDIVLSQDEASHEDIHPEISNIEPNASILTQETATENEIAIDKSINIPDDRDSDIKEIEVILGASSDALFEVPETNQISESKFFDDAALEINPDFDVEAETQFAEFNQLDNREITIDEIDEIDLQALNRSSLASELEQEIDQPAELSQWLDESSDRSSSVTNITEVSADQDLLSWLGDDALDMAKLATQPSMATNPIADLTILNNSAVSSLDSQGIPHEIPELDMLNQSFSNEPDQFLQNPFSDQVSDSEESLILLTSKTARKVDFPEWENSLFNELSSDLERLNADLGADPTVKNSIDQFIRNTPYSVTNLDADKSNAYRTIIEVSAKTSLSHTQHSLTDMSDTPDIPNTFDNPDDLFASEALSNNLEDLPFNQLSEKTEIVVENELQSSPFGNDSSEIPEIFEDSETLFSETSEENPSQVEKISANDKDIDAIFADIIAETAAKYAPLHPFKSNDELDTLFQEVGQISQPESSDNFQTENDVAKGTQGFGNGNGDELDESGVDTILFGFDPTAEIEDIFINQFERSDIASSTKPSINKDDAIIKKLNETDTITQKQQDDDYVGIDLVPVSMQGAYGFAETIEPVEELNTILQSFAGTKTSDFMASSEETNFAVIEDIPTVLENPTGNLTLDDEWSAALEALEAKLNQPITYERSSAVGELSADEFFASLENNKLNIFANASDTSPLYPDWESTSSKGVSLEDLVIDIGRDSDDLLLNEFADTQDQVSENDWESLLHDLNTVNFREPLLDDRREQLGLSLVAPIMDSLDNVLDIDSLVLESRSAALVPPPEEKEIYSLDDTWILGIDFGSTALRTSLLNANTGRVYTICLDDGDELPCRLVWTEDHSLDDPITKDIRVLPKKSQISDLENGEVAIAHFKQFLKLGLPYRGVSTWQPIIQWADHHQTNLRWLIAALKNLIEQTQNRANHPKLPDLGLILLKLRGVVFGYPANWSDTYVLNVREAILKSGLVAQAEQVMAVDQAIAPVLALIHEQKIAQEITLLIDAGAVTTSLCLIKGSPDRKTSDRSKFHIRSLDYAGNSLSQDIIVQLFYPHWQLITNPNRHLCKFDHLTLPEVGTDYPQQRIALQQYLLTSHVGQQMLELADRVKAAFGQDLSVDSWHEDLLGQPIVVFRRELENLILQPFIQRLNRELNAIISNAGILGEDVRQVLLLGNTMQSPSLSRWLSQKLPNAQIDYLGVSIVANGLAVAPLYANLLDVARQQYSDYFLLQEICRLNLTQSINPNQLLKQLQMRGVNIKACRDRILSILQGDLPAGIFPWQEPEHGAVLEDPTLSSELFSGRLFELETDGTYEPNVTKFQQLRVYLQAIIGNMSQTLNEPLVFPEVKI